MAQPHSQGVATSPPRQRAQPATYDGTPGDSRKRVKLYLHALITRAQPATYDTQNNQQVATSPRQQAQPAKYNTHHSQRKSKRRWSFSSFTSQAKRSLQHTSRGKHRQETELGSPSVFKQAQCAMQSTTREKQKTGGRAAPAFILNGSTDCKHIP
eukprot:1157568-Pelagomonas_calceolata.AAC.12